MERIEQKAKFDGLSLQARLRITKKNMKSSEIDEKTINVELEREKIKNCTASFRTITREKMFKT
jgi:hypothetical protein